LYTRVVISRAWMLVLSMLASCSRSVIVEPPPRLESRAPIPVVLETTEGSVRCELEAAHAPQAVAMVVGLATARAAFRDPLTGEAVRRPYYDGLAFFRAIPNVLVQTGCPVGDGSGTPGYRIPLEAHDDDASKLSHAGALLLARYQPPPNRADPSPPAPGRTIGSQIVITLDDMSHLAGEVTVIGSCSDLEIVRRIANDVASGSHVSLLHMTL